MGDYDIQISGGTIVDGTGMPRRTGDVWIKDGRIAQMGGRAKGVSEPQVGHALDRLLGMREPRHLPLGGFGRRRGFRHHNAAHGRTVTGCITNGLPAHDAA